MNPPTEASKQELDKIRGWLLLWVIVLIPHGVGAPILLVRQLSQSGWGPESDSLGLALLVFGGIGNLAGIFLILTRSRIAPAFFTLYPPLLLVLTLSAGDLTGTIEARLAAQGISAELSTPVLLGVLLILNVVLAGLSVGYWSRSRRVQAVFGTRGLRLLRSLDSG